MVQIPLFFETIELYILKKCIYLAGKLGRNIYIYRERERERERAVLVDKKKTYNVVCVGTKKHTQTYYMNSVM